MIKDIKKKEIMGFLSISLLLALFFIFLSSSSLAATNETSSNKPRCRPHERNALLQLKSSLSIDSSIYACNNYLTTWNETVNCCKWGGITCDGVTRHVIGLDLSCNALHGIISSNSSLFSLRHLETLDLSINDFVGSFMLPEFSPFSNMTQLKVSYSNFRRLVPFEISRLSNLVSLQIHQSKEKITIEPETFKALTRNLTNLRELSLDGTDLSFVRPLSLNNLSSHLTSLDLSRCNLRGMVPESVFRLPNLQTLYLSHNEDLTGSFPNTNWSTQIQRLDLSYTNISIDLPHLLNSARFLSSLSLSHCNFVGSYPLVSANLSQLSFLILSFNNFSGQIPWHSLNLNEIYVLDLSHNNFVGQLPQAFAHNAFSSLKVLRLSSNLLDGSIPSWIYALPNLWTLELNNNAFIGYFEFDKFAMGKKIITLNLSSNKFSLRFNNSVKHNFDRLIVLGLSSCDMTEFPNFIRSSKLLKVLDLSQNRIPGIVPDWIGEMSTDFLSIFNLSHNILTTVQKTLPWKNLQAIDLSFNQFSGNLPIFSSSLLTSLIMSNNKFTGPIPTSYCNLKSLQLVDLSYNKLISDIPPCLANASKSLMVLDLQRNRLHGHIPGTFATKNNMKSLNLNGNLLDGQLPTSLANCRNLELLDLGNNMLNGSFPDWLESLTKLQVLVLSSNKFQGSIPNPKGRVSFRELRIIDLSTNRFSGALPTKLFENLKAMMKVEKIKMEYMGKYYYQDSIPVTIKGLYIVLVKIQNILAIIDFSSNNFTGDIPDFIGSLRSLNGLNFSHNMLEGTLPSSLGNLTNLEWLDLSDNDLVGNIPTEFVALTWLQILRLSNNKLEGPIPRGNQFETFNNESYIGNPGLCGFPLSESCSADEARQDQGDDEEHEKSIELEWKVVMMGFASGMVIGISVGYMVLFTPMVDYWFKNRFQREPRHISIAPTRT